MLKIPGPNVYSNNRLWTSVQCGCNAFSVGRSMTFTIETDTTTEQFLCTTRDFSCIFFDIRTLFHKISYIPSAIKRIAHVQRTFFNQRNFLFRQKSSKFFHFSFRISYYNNCLLFSQKKTKSNQLNKEKTQPANTLLAIKRNINQAKITNLLPLVSCSVWSIFIWRYEGQSTKE